MLERRFAGIYVVFLGICSQLVGLIWDAMQHASNEHLAGEEGPLTLTNPSHAMIAGGMALAALGVAWLLIAQSHGQGAKLLPMSALGGLGVLMGVVGGLVLTTPSLSSGHSHGGLTASHHASTGVAEDNPTLVALKEVLRTQGTGPALDELNRRATADPAVLAEAHPIVHALGRYSFAVYGDVRSAFDRCRADYASGCYHGVLEAYFETKSQLSQTDVVAICPKTNDQTTFVRFQCLHGLGHGLGLYLGNDIFKALQFCDGLNGQWDQISCYGGVFMENIMSARADHQHTGEIKTFIKPEDPLYPCNAVAAKYRYQCYELQTSPILYLNGFDYAATAKACEQAPTEYIAVCYRSLGRDVSGAALQDPAKVLQNCRLGSDAYWGECVVGAVKETVNSDSGPARGFRLCEQTPLEVKDACYGAVGEMILALYADPGAREAACAAAESGYVDVCRRAAWL